MKTLTCDLCGDVAFDGPFPLSVVLQPKDEKKKINSTLKVQFFSDDKALDLCKAHIKEYVLKSIQ